MIEQRKHHFKTNYWATQTPLKKLMIEQHKHHLKTNDSAKQTPLQN